MREGTLRWRSLLLSLGKFVLSLLIACLVGGLLLRLVGENPWECYRLIVRHALLSSDGWASILYHATLLTLAGLAVAIPFKAGLFNIGVEGQVTMGGLSCVVVALLLAGWPRIPSVILCLLAGAIGGALWAVVPALLKTRRGVHEVITTILMNICAISLVNYLTTGPMKDPGDGVSPQMNSQTRTIPENCELPSVAQSFPGLLRRRSHPLSGALALAIVLPLVTYVGLYRTRSGFLLCASGKNVEAARLAGANWKHIVLSSFLVSGAVAGLVCGSEVMGYRHRLVDNFSGGLGYQGIVVALLARSHPLAIPLSALLFGFLQKGAMILDARTDHATKEITLVLQATLVLSLIVLDKVNELPRLFLGWRTGKGKRGGGE